MTKVIKTKTTKTFDLSIEQENSAWPKICRKLDNTEEEVITNYLSFIYQLSNVH